MIPVASATSTNDGGGSIDYFVFADQPLGMHQERTALLSVRENS
jgi:hypothetical protein